MKDILENEACELQHFMNNYNNSSEHTINSMSYAVLRCDAYPNTRLKNSMTINITSNNMSYVSLNTSIIVYLGNSQTGTGTYSTYYFNLNTYSKTINTYYGIDYYDYCVIMIINKGDSQVKFTISNNCECIPYDNAQYLIGCNNGSSYKYLTVSLDEFNCITVHRNIYLYDLIQNNVGQYFVLKNVVINNTSCYYIMTYATSYYPDEYPNMRIAIYSSNIETICDGHYCDSSAFNFQLISSGFYKIYQADYSSKIIKAVSFYNGSNSQNSLTSNGNVITSTSYTGGNLEKWEFIPII